MLYWTLKKLKTGISIGLAPTYRCNQNCWYCGNKMGGDVFPKCPEINWEQWRDNIINFPLKIKEVVLSGGEPCIYPEIEKLVNWLLDNGYFVQFYTNLARPGIITKFKRSKRLILFANFHHTFFGKDEIWDEESLLEWDSNYQSLKKAYQIKPEEINNALLPYTKVKRWHSETHETNKHNVLLRWNPAGELFVNCEDRNIHDFKVYK
jgi:organic radical activating enzyme